VRDWEQGRAVPDRAAQILLRVIEGEPDMVRRVVAGRKPDWRGGIMTKVVAPVFIESMAGQVGAELAWLVVAPDQHVTIAIEPSDRLAEVRRKASARVVAQGWSDAVVDPIIDEELVSSSLG
jgi:hypothetical protein